MLSRRDFITRAAGVLPLGLLAPRFWQRAAATAAAEARKDSTILVLLELTGGNDGLNSVVPYADDVYHRSRSTLRVEPAKVLKLDDRVGLHPALKDLHKVWESGDLAIVQNVGYPNPNRSHSRSMEIWQSGSVGPATPAGWLGRLGDANATFDRCHVGQGTMPLAVTGRRTVAQSLASIADFRLVPGATIPASPGDEPGDPVLDQVRRRFASARDLSARLDRFAKPTSAAPDTLEGRLETVRRLIEANTPFRVYYTSLDGFDTHASQLYTHQELLRTLARALGGFLAGLRASRLDERVLVLAFSEFGRRLKENANHGTDHGTAGPVLLAGKAVKAGLVGPHPSLADLDEAGDPRFAIDFRDVYATVLRRWLDVDPTPILGARDTDLPLL
jgi:uncharacterized protein (DUF1501 family)